MSSVFVIALELFEGKDFFSTAILILFYIGPSKRFTSSLNFIEQEAYNLGLVDMIMIMVNLKQWLNECESLVWDALAIDALEH